ncbi:MAG: 3',5'-nucleoside bisphosphate phosphatase [Burkholderiales bacterium]
MNIDLHCHSTASDGLLRPREVVRRAAANGVDMLALTDHDDVSGLPEARAEAASRGVRLVDGVEISVTWEENTIHVVGLAIDPDNSALNLGLVKVRSSRVRRAIRISESLERAGIHGSFSGAMGYVHNPNIISRTHFARFLVEAGHAPDVRSVYQRYLVKGKPGYVPHQWASLSDAVAWIRASGGVAVIAHPGRYGLAPSEMRRLLAQFRDHDGAGIEVVTGSHSAGQYHEFATLAREFGLLVSRGSDFHGEGESRTDLGALPKRYEEMKSVWHAW